jgi:hypothetical protein
MYSTDFDNIAFKKPANLVKISVEIVEYGWGREIRAANLELAAKLHRVLEGKERK